MMTTDRFTTIPEGWAIADEATVDRSLEAVDAAVKDRAVVANLVAYYSRDGNFAGASFL